MASDWFQVAETGTLPLTHCQLQLAVWNFVPLLKKLCKQNYFGFKKHTELTVALQANAIKVSFKY